VCVATARRDAGARVRAARRGAPVRT